MNNKLRKTWPWHRWRLNMVHYKGRERLLEFCSFKRVKLRNVGIVLHAMQLTTLMFHKMLLKWLERYKIACKMWYSHFSYSQKLCICKVICISDFTPVVIWKGITLPWLWNFFSDCVTCSVCPGGSAIQSHCSAVWKVSPSWASAMDVWRTVHIL